MIGSNGSDSGKTFYIYRSCRCNQEKRGYKVAPAESWSLDVRDIIPGLYLIKGKMEEFASIKIGHLGWRDIESTVAKLNSSDYDIVLSEGVI